MKTFLLSVLLAGAFAGTSTAQTASSYYGYSASGNEGIDGYLVVQGGDMGTNCTHTFTDTMDLYGPNGVYGGSNFSGSQMSRTGAFTTRWDDLITIGPAG